MELLKRIDTLLADPMDDMGFCIVRLRFGGEGRTRALQVMAERTDDTPLTIKDCKEISQTAAALLDVEDWIDGQYNLEVSSPGLDRPLIKREDFDRFKGRVAKIELDVPLEGQKKFKGKVLGLDDDGNVQFKIEKNGDEIILPYADIHKARLVITDQMIKEIQRNAKKD